MQNAISTLRIRNFKSIKDVTISPRRVNLIIGEPNVGKSNVLEAMSLLGGMVYETDGRFMGGMVRYERAHQLFYDSITTHSIVLQSDQGNCLLGRTDTGTFKALFLNAAAIEALQQGDTSYALPDMPIRNAYEFTNAFAQNAPPGGTARYQYGLREFTASGDSVREGHYGFDSSTNAVGSSIVVRPYLFTKYKHTEGTPNSKYLLPPHGSNLKSILQEYPSLRQAAANLFKKDSYRLAMRAVSNELEAVKERDGLIYSVPYSSIADTLQRLIFYLAAIESNDDAVILFEEPEAHSYPVYVSQLGRRIAQSHNNQFFVATHSPYLITEILETMLPDEAQAQEVAIFVAYYEDYQTKLRQLTDAEVRGIRNDGLDVFYNMDRLVHPEA